jgi:uncharacterized protein GlcG (DUF336 family)
MNLKSFQAVVALSGVHSVFALATPPSKPVITLAAAQSAIASVVQPSDKRHAPYVISVVDDGGNLIYLERADGALSGMIEASIMKARSAAGYGVTTKILEQQIAQGHPGFQNLPGTLPMVGGVPVRIDGVLVSAVGVAGG